MLFWAENSSKNNSTDSFQQVHAVRNAGGFAGQISPYCKSRKFYFMTINEYFIGMTAHSENIAFLVVIYGIYGRNSGSNRD
jgi:hypothetical protein